MYLWVDEMLPSGVYPQLLRYFIAGALNTLLAYSIYALAIFIGFHYSAAVFLGGVVPIYTSYQSQRRYVFLSEASNRLPRFMAAFVVVYFVNVGILKALLASGLAGGEYLSGALAMVPSVMLSFFLNRHLVFR